MDERVHLKRHRNGSWGLWLGILLFVALIGYLVIGTQQLQGGIDDKQLIFIQKTVLGYVANCYAIEGRYPPDLAYLKNNYGLQVDAERYLIHYECLGGNLMPEVLVYAKPLSK